MRRALPALLVALSAALGTPGGPVGADGPAAAAAAQPAAKGASKADPNPPVQVFLSWRAPHGERRATQSIMAPCGADTSVRDTLWVSFIAGRDAPTLYGVGIHLRFRALPGDTLGPYWWLGEGGPRRLEVQYPGQSGWGYRRPWKVDGQAFPDFARQKDNFRLSITFIVPADSAGAVKDDVPYVLARLIVNRPPAGLARCDQQICIEWAASEFSYAMGVPDAVHGPGSQRFVTWNSPKGDACASYTTTRAAPARWVPKPGTR